MRRTTAGIRIAGLAAALPIVAVACGGGSGNASAKAPTKLAHSCPAGAGLGTKVNDQGVKVATGTKVETEANDSFFTPTCITKVPAGTAMVTVSNFGTSLHNISIPAQGINQDIQPGQTVKVDVTVGTSPVQFFCKYHKSSGRVGALIPGA